MGNKLDALILAGFAVQALARDQTTGQRLIVDTELARPAGAGPVHCVVQPN